MKKLLFSIILTLMASAAISSCKEENVKPAFDGGSNDPCQWPGGPGCPGVKPPNGN